jgi:dihydroorotate dehydrogenase
MDRCFRQAKLSGLKIDKQKMKKRSPQGKRESVDLSVDLGFLRLRNPVLAASGTFGYGLEFKPFVDLDKLGGIVVKGLYFNPRPGNPPPRLAESPSGLINSIGLQGIGVRAFCEKSCRSSKASGRPSSSTSVGKPTRST